MSTQVGNINLVLQKGQQAAPKKQKPKQASFLAGLKVRKSGSDSGGSLSFRALLDYGKKVKLEEIVTFADQLSILLGSGVPLLRALQILSDQTEDPQFKNVISRVADSINAGNTLTQAMSRHPQVFPKLFVSMVRAAETSGEMTAILGQLARYLEDQLKVKKKMKAATAYPKFIFCFFFVVLCAIIFGLVPKFKTIFEDFGAELPIATQILIDISHFAREYLLFEIIALAGLAVLYTQFKKTPTGVSLLDRLKLNLPVIGDVVRKSAISKFCRTLAILIRSGVPLVDALEIAAATTQNVHYISAIQTVKKGVIGGETLNNRLKQHSIFPIMVVSMIATGEQSGSLEEMLTNISNLYDTHVDAKISALSSILEPALMIGLGVVALIVIIALYLPIFYMSNVIQ